MKRVYILAFIAINFLLLTHVSCASFEITEIMYDANGTDTNREWVEVKNTGTSAEDLSKWFLFSGNSKHKLAPLYVGIVPAGGYAVIVQNVDQFKTDFPNRSAMIFDSSWTGFNNTSGTISLKDSNLNMVSPVSYNSSMGGNGNGNSLAKINGVWQNGTPTPGGENIKAVIETPKEISTEKTKSTTPKSKNTETPTTPIQQIKTTEKEIINLNDVAEKENIKNNIGHSDLVYIFGLIAVLGLGIFAFLHLKKEHSKSEKISAEDITIIK